MTSHAVVGAGTALNVVTILAGTTVGALVGDRLPARLIEAITEAIGLVVLLVAALNLSAVLDAPFVRVAGSGTLLIVLFAAIGGTILGTGLRIEDRLESLGSRLRQLFVRADGGQPKFVEGFVTASLLFAIGPLGILGSLSDGLGRGIDQLVLKSVLDGITSIAFGAAFGWGVAGSALVVGVYQAIWTGIGVGAGSFLTSAELSATTATGGLMIMGIGLRLLKIRQVGVANLLPALLLAPTLTWIVATARGR